MFLCSHNVSAYYRQLYGAQKQRSLGKMFQPSLQHNLPVFFVVSYTDDRQFIQLWFIILAVSLNHSMHGSAWSSLDMVLEKQD